MIVSDPLFWIVIWATRPAPATGVGAASGEQKRAGRNREGHHDAYGISLHGGVFYTLATGPQPRP